MTDQRLRRNRARDLAPPERMLTRKDDFVLVNRAPGTPSTSRNGI